MVQVFMTVDQEAGGSSPPSCTRLIFTDRQFPIKGHFGSAWEIDPGDHMVTTKKSSSLE